MKKKILLLFVSLCITIMMCEITLRLLRQPSTKSYGLLFNQELPPVNIFQENIALRIQKLKEQQGIDKNIDNPFNSLVIKGNNITQSDIWGIMRLDKTLGYTVKENSISTNQWWKSNNIGARSAKSTLYKKSQDYKRILFFGDSFTQGTSVAQDETFISYLNERDNKIEAVNFGVNGYSMGQSFIRFGTLKDKIEFDYVILVFVPDCDLPREINVSRYIGFRWDGFNDLILMPRFVIENGELTLINSPYFTLNELFEDNPHNITNKISDHLRKYDAFYFRFWYENHSIIDKSILFKLVKHIIYNSARASIIHNLLNTNGEALRVTKAIIHAMAHEIESKGAKFSLLILPTNEDIYRYSTYPDYKKSWDDMYSFLCDGQFNCYDLMENLRRVSMFIDRGYDGTHYGPKANSIIANIILKRVINN